MTATDTHGFELHEQVAQGGMGVVFRATRAGRTVAFKVLRPDLITTDVAARFAREVESVRALSHEGIVGIEQAGVLEDGRPFIAYEWLEGTTLATHGPTSTRRAVEIVGAILDALAFAHGNGFVHRDITPRNVMLSADTPKLIDFGLVASLQRSVDADTWTRLTRTGFVVGTPPYMAPEQIEGDRVTARTDLWAVGVVLHWLVSGSEPFMAKTPTLRMLKIVSEPLRPLAEHSVHVSASLAAVVHRALEKDPEARFDSAQEMASALRAAAVSDALPESARAPLDVTRTR